MVQALALFERADSEYAPIGAKTGVQTLPKIAWISSSQYVAVWTDDALVGGVSNPQVLAQIFDADGTPAGAEFMVNGNDGGVQTNAVVAALTGGGFVIAWEDRNEPSDGSGSSIFYQVYGADGSPGVSGPANATTTFDQSRPSIAGLEGGDFVITWTDDSRSGGDTSGLAVRGRVFSATGGLSGNEFLVNTTTTNAQTGSNVVALPGGGFAVVWEDDSPQGTAPQNMSRADYGSNIAIQIFDASANKVGAERVVDDATPEVVFGSAQSTGRVTAHNPVAVVLPNGTIAVAWDDDWDGYVKTRLLNADGSPATAVQNVGNASGTLNPAPSIVALADGGYAVSWTAFRAGPPDASGRGVMARVYGADGAPQGVEFQVNSSISGDQRASTMLAFDDGSFLVAWHDATTTDLAAQRFREDSGTISDIALSVASISKGAIENIQAAILSADGALNAPFTYQLLNDPTGAFRIEGDRLVVADTGLLHGFGPDQATITFRVTDSNGNSFDEAIEIPLTAAPASALFVAGHQAPVTFASAASNAQTPEVIALPDGGYFLTWVEGAGGAFDVKGQFYEANGSHSAPFTVNTVTTGTQFESSAIVLANGNLVVTWHGQTSFAAGNSASDVKGQILDPNGAKVGGEFAVNTILPQNQTRPVSTALADGGFLVTWADASLADDPSSTGIKAQFFTANGTKVGTEFLVNTTTAGAQTSPYVAQLHDGTIVIAWSDASATGDDTSGTAIRARFYSAAGAPIGGEFLVNTTTLHSQLQPVVTVLADGRFVIVWGDTSEGTGGTATSEPADIRAQIFDAAGNRIGGEFLVNSETFGFQGQGSLGIAGVAADAVGGFVVTWTSGAQVNSDGDLGAIKAQLFGADGGKVGSEFLVNQIGANHQGTPAVAFLGDGDLVFAFWDLSSSRTGDNRAIATRRFDSDLSAVSPNVIDGTPGNDVIFGTPEADLMSGYGGNDTLAGGGEDDSIHGGDGDDTLRGEDGDDELFGEAGNDTLEGGLGGDRLAGGNDNDTLRGQDGDDELLGEAGSDILEGGAGDDRLAGGAGGDTYSGGDGIDTLDFSGEPGPVSVNLSSGFFLVPVGPFVRTVSPNEARDSFGNYETLSGIENLVLTASGDRVLGSDGVNRVEAGGGNDEVFGMGGNDVLLGGAGDDVLEGGLGDDSLDGGDGNDELVGEGGNDTIDGGLGDDIIFGDAGDDTIDGGAGSDVIFGNAGNDTIEGGDGFDLLHGNDGDDLLSGEGGNDLLRGYAGVDTYDGGAEDGLDPGNSGYGDRLSFFDSRATQGVVADLRTGIVSNDGYGNVETMTNIESLGGGTAFVDTFYGNDSINAVSGGAGDNLYGFGGDDIVQLRGAAAVADGGSGTDLLTLLTLGDYRPDSNGDGVAELSPDMTSGYIVDLAAGTVRDGNNATGTVAGIENVSGTQFADELRGDGGDNRLDGGAGNDQLRSGAGTDRLLGGDGNDVLYFGAQLSGGDSADGGAGRDVMVLQGNYVAGLASVGLADIESISLQSGARTTWGDTANNFYDYDITMADANVPAGVQLIVNAQSLRVGEDFTFDGSAEMDGRYLVYGGHGVDTLKGGAGADAFFFEGGRFQAGDTVDGGGGRDSIIISSGSGVNRFEFSDTSFTNIESISVNNRYTTDPTQKPSYELILANGNVAAGATLILNGSSITDPTQTVTFDGSAVENGNLILFSGAGEDTLIGGAGADLLYAAGGGDDLTGGGGADTFQYRSTSDSTAANPDQIHDFEGGVDKVDLHFIDADTTTDGDQAFTVIGSAQFGGHAGELRIVDMGNNMWLMMADTDGNGEADFHLNVIRTDSSAMIASDFIL